MRGQMANSSSMMTVVDVYDVAASIGKEFERIIDDHGPEAVTELMPKVITVLEQLEILAANYQKENAEISELRFAVERLTAEKVAKTEERLKYEQEVEAIEDSWRLETRELVETVARLQDDNKKLRGMLSQQQLSQENQNKLEQEAETRRESELQQLRESVHRQRVERRGLQKEITSKTVDLEAMTSQLETETRLKVQAQREAEQAREQVAGLEQQRGQEMQSQLERMAKLNAEYRRKTTLTQQRAQNLIQEKADLQADSSDLQWEMEALQAMLHDKEQQISTIRANMSGSDSVESPASPVSAASPQLSDDDMGRLTERLIEEGKILIDLKDPDRPRFTLNELREVLTERNTLKTKLIEVEEELNLYKPVEMSRQEEEEEDPPVQGPLPKEPDEKLFPGRKGESGIRKFFNFLLSPGKNQAPRQKTYNRVT